jgi:hypothetical protein
VMRRGWEISYRDAPIDDLADPAIENADLLIVPRGCGRCAAPHADPS